MSNLAVRRHLFWCRRLAGHRSGPYFLWGSLLKFRREFDQYVNLRPFVSFLAFPARWRENSLATSILRGQGKHRRRIFLARRQSEEGTEHEVVIQESVFTRRGVDAFCVMPSNLRKAAHVRR